MDGIRISRRGLTPGADRWGRALVAATGLHAGFQLSVSAVVYPALADLAAADWPRAHAAHSRRIGPVVGVVYPLLALAVVGRLLQGTDRATVLAAAGSGGAAVLTAGLAAPLHGQLGRGHDRALLAHLLRADRGRSVCALVALGAALASTTSPRPALPGSEQP